MKKILVTGGAGFIGSNACNILAGQGCDMIAFDNLVLGKKELLSDSVTFVEGDVTHSEELDRIGPVDCIIHLAGASSAPMFIENLSESMLNNVVGYTNILEFARKNNVKKIIFASTSSIYGNNPVPLNEDQSVAPPNFYAVAKHTMEELSAVYSKLYNIEIIGFRFMSVYGLHEEHKGRFANLVSQFIWGIEQDRQPVIYGDGGQTRDFTNVRDIVSAFSLAMNTEKRFGFTVFNVGTANAINLRDLVALINGIMCTNKEPKFIVNPVGDGYVAAQLADLSKIGKNLCYDAKVSLRDGITEIVKYRKSNPTAPTSLSY